MSDFPKNLFLSEITGFWENHSWPTDNSVKEGFKDSKGHVMMQKGQKKP
jgi:hypothetical protein